MPFETIIASDERGAALNLPAEKPDAHAEKARKPYSKPSLQIYGGILELTQAHNNTGATDGGTPGSGASKTN